MVLVRRSLALALAAVLVAAPAAAQTETAAPAVDGLVALQAEVLLLVELQALPAVPPALSAVHAEWSSYTEGFTREGLIRWLYEVDADGAQALAQIAQDESPPPGVRRALGRLSSDDRLSIESGGAIGVDPGDYVAALGFLDDLERADAPTPGSARPSSPTGTDRDVTTVAADPAATPGGDTTNDYPWGAVSSALFAVLAAGIAMILVGRRRAASAGPGRDFDRLLDAGRRMTAALDADEIAVIATDEAVALTASRLGAFVAVDDDGLWVRYETGELIDDRGLSDGAIVRVAATGRSHRAVSNDEPALTALPAAVLAVPVIGRGRVVGVIVVVRPDDAPFGTGDEDVVGRLAPMVGSALAAAAAHDDVSELTRTDALTGLRNRRSLDADLSASLMSLPEGALLGVVMIDVDHFKQFNDTNGHAAGDQALRAVADAMRTSIRVDDVAYRYGGEEFSLLLRNVGEGAAMEVAERVRHAVADLTVVGAELQPGGSLTVSVGVALVAGGDVDGAIAAADAALYRAKESGRNRVVLASAPALA